MTMTSKKRLTQNGAQAKRSIKLPFDGLDEVTTHLWIEKAQSYIGKAGFTYDEFDYAELVYCTAVYLYNIEPLLSKAAQFPCYVVHGMDDESRFVSASFEVAFGHWKRLSKEQRAALFHWPSRGECKRLHASDGYAYSRDFGMDIGG